MESKTPTQNRRSDLRLLSEMKRQLVRIRSQRKVDKFIFKQRVVTDRLRLNRFRKRSTDLSELQMVLPNFDPP